MSESTTPHEKLGIAAGDAQSLKTAAQWLEIVKPIAKFVLSALVVLGNVYIFRYCEHYGVPFPGSHTDLLRLVLVTLALAVYGTAMTLGFAILPTLLPRSQLEAWTDFAFRMGIPIALAFASDLVARRDAYTLSNTLAILAFAWAGIACFARVQPSSIRIDRSFTNAGLSLLTLCVGGIWIAILTGVLYAWMDTIDADESLREPVTVAFVALTCVAFNALLKLAQRIRERSVFSSIRYFVGGILLMMTVAVLLPAPIAPFVAKISLRALGQGGDTPIRLVLKPDASGLKPSLLGVADGKSTTCTLYVVLDTPTTYFVRRSTELRDPVISVATSDVIHTVRGDDLDAPCPNAPFGFP